MIFIYSFGLFRGGTNYSSVTSTSSIECVGYSFRIVGGTLEYVNGSLKFEVEPSGGGEINKLIIRSGIEETETRNIDFSASYKQTVKANVPVTETFEVYPKGCEENIKQCNITSMTCEK